MSPICATACAIHDGVRRRDADVLVASAPLLPDQTRIVAGRASAALLSSAPYQVGVKPVVSSARGCRHSGSLSPTFLIDWVRK